MKTKTSSPKTELLLGAGLDVLHQESLEWQDTVAFWKDETKFFSYLLHKKDSRKSNFTIMLSHLDSLHKSLFDYLADDIVDHEKFLAHLVMGEKRLSDGTYREKHRRLSQQMEIFSSDFKEFKKMVFGFAKKL
ncbi:MAG: hypothetical protein WBM53_10670 [Maribacter sp.]